MYDHAEFVRTTSEFAQKLIEPYEVHEVLGDLAERTSQLLALAGGGVTVEVDDRVRAITTVPEWLADLGRHQEDTQRGPCIDASATGAVVAVADLRADMRWPDYRTVAARIGVRSAAGIPMHLGTHTLGALNLYGEAPRIWDAEDLAAAQVLTDLATGFLINASSHAKQALVTEQLQHALDSRIVIEQAKGILAEARGLEVARAFDVMRKYARDRNLRLVEVARAIVHMGLRP
ncbi:GAF and ANTAR domain-containing protein [Occultella aeris]|uniref:Nitrate regulatory protein n=1 Tax=Occultella aeris TaxID=2761496 RepID=A0A7M4DRW4_9MICO|nr:GAF and ANTAR domain-containing protein [Occultella aeris]VZO40208.1 Nitrate regulatory protein [Occultella aeris]